MFVRIPRFLRLVVRNMLKCSWNKREQVSCRKFRLNRSLLTHSVYADAWKNTEEYGKNAIMVSVGLNKMFRRNDISLQCSPSECRYACLLPYIFVYIYVSPYAIYGYGKWRPLFSLSLFLYVYRPIGESSNAILYQSCLLSLLKNVVRLWRDFHLIDPCTL